MKKIHLTRRPSYWTLIFLALFGLSTAVYAQPKIEWSKCYGGSKSDVANCIYQTKDGGFIICGYSQSSDSNLTKNNGGSDYWIVKTDYLGNIQWQKSYGGSLEDFPTSIEEITNGGFIVSGWSISKDGDVIGNYGWYDYWILKLDPVGNIEWQWNLGGTSTEMARSIQQTNDGGYVVAGFTGSRNIYVIGNHGASDVWITKLDTLGLVEWAKCFGGSKGDEAYSVKQTFDGGYIFAGKTSSNDSDVIGYHQNQDGQDYPDYWIGKLNSTGNMEWQQTLGGIGTDIAYSVEQTKDSGYIVAGRSDIYLSNSDYLVIKLNSSGEVLWQKSFGGIDVEVAQSVKQTIDGGYIVVGFMGNGGGQGVDYWIIKLDSLGNMEWQKSLGGLPNNYEYSYAYSIVQTTDGGLIVAGGSNSTHGDVKGNHGKEDFWIVKLAPCKDSFYNHILINTSNTSNLVSIDTSMLVKVDTISDKIITTTDSIFISHYLDTTIITKDSIYFKKNQCKNVADSVIYTDTISSLITYVSDTITHQFIDTNDLIGVKEFQGLPIEVYPNPFTNEIHIKINKPSDIILFDSAGRIIDKRKGFGHLVFKTNVPSGVYFLKVISKDNSQTFKLIAE